MSNEEVAWYDKCRLLGPCSLYDPDVHWREILGIWSIPTFHGVGIPLVLSPLRPQVAASEDAPFKGALARRLKQRSVAFPGHEDQESLIDGLDNSPELHKCMHTQQGLKLLNSSPMGAWVIILRLAFFYLRLGSIAISRTISVSP